MAFSVLLRAILDFTGVAALIPNIANSGETRWRAEYDAGIVWCRITVCVTKECFGYVFSTRAKPLPVGDILGIQQADVGQLLSLRAAF